MEILSILVISVILSSFFVFNLGNWGVLLAGIITGIAGAWVVSLIMKLGNPNGAVRRATKKEVSSNFTLWSVGGLIVYYALNLIVLLFHGQPISFLLTIIWGVVVILLLLFYFVREAYLKINKNSIYVTFGYDDELDYEYGGIYVNLIKGGKKNSISFNSRGYSTELNRYGFRQSSSGSKTIYYKPNEIYISIRGYQSVTLPVDQDVEDITLYLNKQNELKVYLNEKLEASIQLEHVAE